jgi:hypothetical protein
MNRLRVGCWYIMPDGAVAGWWLLLPSDAGERDEVFQLALAAVQDAGAVAVWCEPYELPPGFRPERVIYEKRKRTIGSVER